MAKLDIIHRSWPWSYRVQYQRVMTFSVIEFTCACAIMGFVIATQRKWRLQNKGPTYYSCLGFNVHITKNE